MPGPSIYKNRISKKRTLETYSLSRLKQQVKVLVQLHDDLLKHNGGSNGGTALKNVKENLSLRKTVLEERKEEVMRNAGKNINSVLDYLKNSCAFDKKKCDFL